jgi:hypothetical protein
VDTQEYDYCIGWLPPAGGKNGTDTMAYAKKGFKEFDLGNGYRAECHWEKTRYGFRHIAVLRENGSRVCEAKACYYNRTWERYEYESVLEDLVRKFAKADRGAHADAVLAMKRAVEDDGFAKAECAAAFGPVRALMALGSLMGADEEQRVRLRVSALKALPGIILPDDFDNLPIEERKRRLDAVEAELRKE